ncbi:MAG: DNA polymerase IV [Spirochaetae bacterium HGW-Spirochaetae-9]|nr:MAG: DNA polymerase IV [Spirochaetae bacterium HGW-Spirochaetae-9]
MPRIFFHVDLDAFFASVEQCDNPLLKGKPVIVGAAPGHRGVVSTCSYEARAFGLHSAMPISEACKRCPKGIFLPVRMARYAELSRTIMRILEGFTPDMTQMSIDEAMLDMTGTQRLWGEADAAAALVKKSVFDATGLTVSIGASGNRYIAKIASGIRKPDGYLRVPDGEEKAFMRSLPLEKLWGAGEKTRLALRDAGISTITELQTAAPRILEAKFGKAGAAFLSAAASGEDTGFFSGEAKTQSMSGERTFERDTTDGAAVRDLLRLLADELAARICDEGSRSVTLGLKLRFGDFSTLSRQCTREEPYGSADEIYEDALHLLDSNWDGLNPLRLVGLGLHNLRKGACVQGQLFEKESGKSEEVRRTVQEIDARGGGRLVRARFLPGKPH